MQDGEILFKKKGSFILLESEGNFITDWGSYILKQRKFWAKSTWAFGKIKISQTNNLSEPITVSIRLQTPLKYDMFVISLRYGLCFLVHFDCKSLRIRILLCKWKCVVGTAIVGKFLTVWLFRMLLKLIFMRFRKQVQ